MHDAIRRLAGACYMALRTGNPEFLHTPPDTAVLAASGLAGMHANLCVNLGIACDRATVVRGMHLAAVNTSRWQALTALLQALENESIAPVLFKGGALHARWPPLRELRALSDYDLLVPQSQVGQLRNALAQRGYTSEPVGSRLTQYLIKGWMVCKGSGDAYENLDIHARVTEPPVCTSLTRSMLDSTCRADGIRVPDIEDCVCMIALHIVRSGMYRPLREYTDLLWYVDEMPYAQWQSLLARARTHHLLPALFLSLRQAVHCLAMEELAPERAAALNNRITLLARYIGPVRRHLIDKLAPAGYPLAPIARRNHPAFRRSIILSVGTSSLWRVGAAFLLYGSSRVGEALWLRGKQRNADLLHDTIKYRRKH